MKSIPNRPAISNVLIKASANTEFRTRLLNNPEAALREMNLAPDDVEILAGIQADTLQEFARQVKQKLKRHRVMLYARDELDLPAPVHPSMPKEGPV